MRKYVCKCPYEGKEKIRTQEPLCDECGIRHLATPVEMDVSRADRRVSDE